MAFLNEIDSLTKEIESALLTDKLLETLISKSKKLLHKEFGTHHSIIKRLDSISTEPKEAYFPEMMKKEKKNALKKCKDDLLELLVYATHDFNGLIIDKSFDEIILNEESEFLEFKSTLVWDVNNSKPEKKMMGEIIMKSISAFSNSDGGVLLIGIKDDKEILGLDLDFKTFNNGQGTRDDFELHLTTLVINSFSKTFAKDNIRIEFPISNSKEICLIRIRKGIIPYTIKISDKSGQQKEKFFIRVNNSSRDIDNLLEFARYVKTRFKDWN